MDADLNRALAHARAGSECAEAEDAARSAA
jgi:hypothetical protein